MNLFSEDIEFVKELYAKRSVNIYVFHEKYMLSPAQLGRTIKKFLDLECIRINNDNGEITEKGLNWIIANRQELFLNSKYKYWKNVPFEMEQEAIKTDDTYKPNTKKLDPELFKTLEDGE